jgi:hypothetical protein
MAAKPLLGLTGCYLLSRLLPAHTPLVIGSAREGRREQDGKDTWRRELASWTLITMGPAHREKWRWPSGERYIVGWSLMHSIIIADCWAAASTCMQNQERGGRWSGCWRGIGGGGIEWRWHQRMTWMAVVWENGTDYIVLYDFFSPFFLGVIIPICFSIGLCDMILPSPLSQSQCKVSLHSYQDWELGNRATWVSWWWHSPHIWWNSHSSLLINILPH